MVVVVVVVVLSEFNHVFRVKVCCVLSCQVLSTAPRLMGDGY
jgi:hypothetical protein